MSDVPNVPLLIQMSLSNDQNQIDQATQALLQIIDNPASIQIFMELFENEQNNSIRIYYLTYISKILTKHWNSYTPEQQKLFLEKLCVYVQNSQDSSITFSLANLFSSLFSITGQISIVNIVLSSNINDFIFYWFTSSGDDLPNDFVASNIQKFIELGNWGLAQPNLSHFSGSAKLFTIILQFTSEPQVFALLCQYVMQILPNEPNLTPDLKNVYWSLVSHLFSNKLIPMNLLGQFLAVLSKSSIGLDAINCFSDIVKDMSHDLLVEFFKLDVELMRNKVMIDMTLPDDTFDIVYNLITEKSERQLVLDMIRTLIAGDSAQQITGIYLMIPFIETSPVTSQEEVTFIVNCLINALKSPLPAFQQAAFRVIDNFEDSSSEMISHFPTLIELTSQYLSSNDKTICSLAYASLVTLLSESDNEIEGLLPAVWSLLSKNMVNDLMLTSFIEVIALLIQRTESLDDDIVDSILAWLDTIFGGKNPKDIVTRSAALEVIAALITNEESMCDDMIPLCQQTVAEAFKEGNQEAIYKACEYLNTIAVKFKQRSISIISPFVQNLAAALTVDKYRILAVNTGSFYTGYSGDKTLLDQLCPVVQELLSSDDSICQDCGCTSASNLARVLTDKPLSLDFYKLVLKILVEEKEQELLVTAFKAAKSLFKRCRGTNIQQFNFLTYTFLSNLMAGQTSFLGGVPPFRSPKMDALIQDTMEFFGVFFKSSPENVTPICASLIEWMKQTSEKNMFSIIGALADALEFCKVEESVPVQMCVFVQTAAKSINEPDLQQNVAYFLALLCRLFPQQVALVQQVFPCVVNWWSRALSKKSGFQEVISNIASFFLSFVLIDQNVPENLIVGALQSFPPADLLETETQCSAMVQMVQRNIASPAVLVEMALALSRLFIESQSQLETRKIPQNVFVQAVQVFKQLMQNQQIQAAVFSRYEKRKAKKKQLEQLLSQ